jgi:starch synthase
MKVLHVASECAPFVKTGGLADVVGAVPKALGKLGVSVRVLLPAYPALCAQVNQAKPVWHDTDLFGGKARLLSVTADGIDLLLLDAPHLYERPGSIYLDASGQDWHDNHTRFGALCHIAAQIGVTGIEGWKPDIVHAHDWQAGLVPVLLKQRQAETPKSVISIHNIAFQGLFDASTRHVLGIDDRMFTSETVEYWGKVGFLKGGIALADRVTTVSHTYARELMTAEFGMGLEGLMQSRRDDLSGILNGIDLDVWNPATDPELKRNYTSRSLNRKAVNRAEIERRFGLNAVPSAPLFCVISRLTTQKGLDVLRDALPHLVANGAQLALLGSGDRDLEAGFQQAARDHAGSVGVVIGYDEKLSHLLQGGSDAILVPSRFEPCGLTQLYGLRYGTLPVVAETGGLADTVVDATTASLKSKQATGFTFSPVNVEHLQQVISRVCHAFAQPDIWRAMQRAAMRYPVGWEKSAAAYLQLYRELVADTLPATGEGPR